MSGGQSLECWDAEGGGVRNYLLMDDLWKGGAGCRYSRLSGTRQLLSLYPPHLLAAETQPLVSDVTRREYISGSAAAWLPLSPSDTQSD
jgi:hypothetical protein